MSVQGRGEEAGSGGGGGEGEGGEGARGPGGRAAAPGGGGAPQTGQCAGLDCRCSDVMPVDLYVPVDAGQLLAIDICDFVRVKHGLCACMHSPRICAMTLAVQAPG